MDPLVSGYYGMKNFGDDVFVDTVLSASLFDHARIASPPIPHTGTSDRDAAASYLLPRMLQAAHQNAGFGGKAFRLAEAEIFTRQAQSIAFAGGSLFHGNSRVMSRQVALATRRKIRLVAVGVSFGPFRSVAAQQRALRSVVAFDAILVRDELSYARLAAGGIEHSILMGDLAALHPSLQADSTPAERSDYAVFAPMDLLRSNEAQDAAFSTLLQVLVERNGRLVILALNAHPNLGDHECAKMYARKGRLAGLEVRVLSYGDLGLAETIGLLGRARAVVSTRLHGAIVPYLFGIPFMLVEYQEKCTQFLMDIGVPEAARATGHGRFTFLLGAWDGHPELSYPAMSPTRYRLRAHGALGRMRTLLASR